MKGIKTVTGQPSIVGIQVELSFEELVMLGKQADKVLNILENEANHTKDDDMIAAITLARFAKKLASGLVIPEKEIITSLTEGTLFEEKEEAPVMQEVEDVEYKEQ